MPKRPGQICRGVCCNAIAVDGKPYCKVCLPNVEEYNRKRAYKNAKPRPTAAKRGYNSRWNRTRKGFLAKHPFCIECNRPATVVDHIIPFRKGDKPDWVLFWDRQNWQPLCKSCHDKKTARGK